ncbi:MAG: gliding motility-associated C-terminal domain-containing protein [Bacteroidia bacterium]|nr:gliding motility-associated C-terminal domain-containing protein [Bacteroidia bacterium]
MHSILKYLIPVLLGILPAVLPAQTPACPSVVTGPNQTICSGCTNITATIQGTVATTGYTVASIPYSPYPYNVGTPILVGIDDVWSAVVNLPFCFEYYGNTYTQCLIGSNGLVSFDLANANGYNTWPISTAMPSNMDPDMLNCIMGPWHDIDPGVGGTIYWQIGGTAPCRYLVVSFYQIPMFSCNNLIATHQTVLYETTNVIDIYIQNKPTCTTWNGGAAIEGLNNQTGTAGVIVPGRNFPTQWNAANDAQRFTPNGAPQYTFSWLDGNNNVVGNTPTLNVCPTTTTTYTAVVTNQTCSGTITVTATTTVTVGGLQIATVSTPSSCSGNTGTATATPTGPGPFTYLWSPGNQTGQTATGLSSGVYTVTISDPNGCTGTATVTVGNPGNISTAVANQTNIPCFGQNNGSINITVTGGTGPFNYNWSPSGGTTTNATGLSAGTYTFTVTDANGCTSSQTITITQPPQLTLNTTNTVPTACGQNNGSATVSAGGGNGAYTYNWAPNGGNGSSATGLGVGIYTITVTDANGCTATTTANIAPTNPAVATFSGIDTVGCAPLCVTFSNTSPSATTCMWDFGDGGNSTNCNPVYCYPVPGTYNVTLTITDASGCPGTVTHTAMVIVQPQPTANFSASPQPASVSNPTVYFTDGSSNATAWQWYFGDPNNSTSTQQNPSFTYSAPGTYTVTLIVTNGNCSDTIFLTVVVEEDFTFYAPNAITPNGDGNNQVFLPRGIMWDMGKYELYIYDRWGNRIFETTDPTLGWDGKVQGGSGRIVQEDVYVWKVIVYDHHAKKHEFVGHVSVIR